MTQALLFIGCVLWSAELLAQSPYYQGKTITVIAAASAGSAYDLYARLMAQFMGKHIPGSPNFLVQNMTGAGSIISGMIGLDRKSPASSSPRSTARSISPPP